MLVWLLDSYLYRISACCGVDYRTWRGVFDTALYEKVGYAQNGMSVISSVYSKLATSNIEVLLKVAIHTN